MNEVVFKTLKEKDFIVKNYLTKVATELKLSLNEFLLLMYFTNQDVPSLNIENIVTSVNLNENEIMEAFSKLVGINLITVSVEKNEHGMMEEVINLDNIIKFVTTDITKKHSEEEKDNIFEVFEREFCRQLSPMEYERINQWLNSGVSKELIIEALREAIYNGAKSIKYIERILISWQEKGYKSKNDVNNGLKKESEDSVLTDLFDYDWLND